MRQHHKNVGRQGQETWEDSPAWRASIWDEVCSTADGALLRTIKILITDGPQLDSEETV
jgi:hypothetical protein